MRKITLLSIMTALLMLASFEARAQQGVQNYVSASGYVIFNAPFYNTGTDGYAFDFENDYVEGQLVGWKTIDADGDSYNWTLSPLGEGYGRNGSDGVVLSYSYSSYSGALNPNNYLVSPHLAITAANHFVTFYACALDEAYPADHFGLAVSTTGTSVSDFTMLQEWTMTAKQGGWHEYSVDLNAYVGQNIYIAIRHFNSQDNFCLCVDDIFVGPQAHDPLINCSIALDGNVVANNVTGTQYLLNTEGFANGSAHNTTITATYQSGATLSKSTDWTFRSGAGFQGSPTGLHANSDGSSVNLSWTLPMMNSSYVVDELFYDFADSTMSDLTLIDANHDGYNFKIYPYGGYGGGNCLKSDSWMTGNVGSLNPDNFLVTPHLTATENTVFSFMLRDSDMPGIAPDPEHFGVAVSTAGNTNPSDFTMVQEWNSTGSYTEYSVNLGAYAGQQIYIALRHFNTTGDTYYIYVDDIRITGVEASIIRPAKGAMVYANGELLATLNHGETSFTHMVNRYNSEYCICVIQEGSKTDGTYYALASPQCATVQLECMAPKNLSASYNGPAVTLNWEREIFTDFEDDPQGWSFLDADGDGFVFGVYAAGGMEPNGSVNATGTNASLASFSYIDGYGNLTPDNYAFMPLTTVLPNAHVEFYAAGFDPSYPAETFSFVVASSDGMNITTLNTWTTSNPYSKYTVDLSAYAGQQVFLGFRHHSAVAAYALVIDNITVTNAVWAGTASVTDWYNIYRSSDGVNYSMIGYASGDETSYVDNDIVSVNQYYKVTAVNTIAGGHHCESEPAMSIDGIHDYVQVTTDEVDELDVNVGVYPNPTSGIVNIDADDVKNVMVMNALGQKVFETTDNQIDLSQFGNGVFMLRIETENGTSVQRIVVR
ncbi:MAG: choice-of-anchor J domain-containing protein [Bacteroidales bacterium]|nr:choice-of-anchor J domain-containing protein [Bacteroidales bacterium]